MTPGQWLLAIPACILAAFAIAFGVPLIFRLIWGDDDDLDTYADYCKDQDRQKDVGE